MTLDLQFKIKNNPNYLRYIRENSYWYKLLNSNPALFKEFVKSNPSLLKYVKNKEMTWQQFYEMYDMYGENNDIWNKYLIDKKENKTNDFINYFKNINLDQLQESINSIQRVIGVFSDIENKNETKNDNYEPKPIYKHFDD